MNGENTQNSENNNNQTNKTKNTNKKWLFAMPIGIAMIIAFVLFVIYFKTDLLKSFLEVPLLGIFFAIIFALIPIALIILGLTASVGGFVANEVMEKVDELASSPNPKDRKKANYIMIAFIVLIGALVLIPKFKDIYRVYFYRPDTNYKYDHAIFAKDDTIYYRFFDEHNYNYTYLRKSNITNNKDKKIMDIYDGQTIELYFIYNNNLYLKDNYNRHYSIDLKTNKLKEINNDGSYITNVVDNKYIYAKSDRGQNSYIQKINLEDFIIVKEQKLGRVADEKETYINFDTLDAYFTGGWFLYHNEDLIYKLPDISYHVVYGDNEHIYLLRKGELYRFDINAIVKSPTPLGGKYGELYKMQSNTNESYFFKKDGSIYRFNKDAETFDLLVEKELDVANINYLYAYKSRNYVVFFTKKMNSNDLITVVIYDENTKKTIKLICKALNVEEDNIYILTKDTSGNIKIDTY